MEIYLMIMKWLALMALSTIDLQQLFKEYVGEKAIIGDYSQIDHWIRPMEEDFAFKNFAKQFKKSYKDQGEYDKRKEAYIRNINIIA
jgi:hypothetical protein